jgi:plastocyanin
MPSLTPPDAVRRSWRIPLQAAALAGVAALVLTACTSSGYGASSEQSPSRSAAAVHPSASVAVAQPVVDVDISNFTFTPAQLTVKAGSTIRWTNGGHLENIIHSVNFPAAGIDSGVLHHSDQFTHRFTTPGTYPYICQIHPFMHGTVVVTP